MDIRPIDGNALVARLSKIREEIMDLYDRLRKGSYERVLYYGKFTAINEAIIDIERDAPTLDCAPVAHGEWVKQKNGRLICSLCGVRGLQDSDELDYYYCPSVYCPNCGAKMDGGTKNG